MIYICIPVFNRIEYTLKCIESIKAQKYRNYTIIICDDGSTDNTSEIISQKYGEVILIQGDGNLWWTGGINKCISKAFEFAQNSDYIFTLNNDTILCENTLETLFLQANTIENSIWGALNVYFDDPSKIERSAFIKSKYLFRYKEINNKKYSKCRNNIDYIEVCTLSGKGVLIPITVFKKIGFYNFEKLPHYHADTEFILRAARHGFKIYLSLNAKLKSHYQLSGIGTWTSKPKIVEFVKSFNNIKSTHHFKTLSNYHKLIYGRFYLVQLMLSILYIIVGFCKRLVFYYFQQIFKKLLKFSISLKPL